MTRVINSAVELVWVILFLTGTITLFWSKYIVTTDFTENMLHAPFQTIYHKYFTYNWVVQLREHELLREKCPWRLLYDNNYSMHWYSIRSTLSIMSYFCDDYEIRYVAQSAI